jgi:L-asparaginase/beta-aspartyl-peptidase (threonine type)
MPGRVGDSPVIGSGTWADNNSCAVSGTGHGEFFIRGVLAYDIHARMGYGNDSLAEAADAALATIAEMGGSGGLIAVDRDGNLSLPFNSPGMYRAWVGVDGISEVAIY